MNRLYDIIVVGGGHAGIEAALASARLNKNTALISLSIENIGKMPCNPSVGGPAKGIVVREIDALGGQMGKTADATALQFKMLNTTKGPGVQSLRVQSDKVAYKHMMQDVCLNQKNLDVIEAQVTSLLVKDNKACGVIINDEETIESKIVILTTGTYMSSNVMVGHTSTPSGPDGEPTTNELSESLKDAGLELFRLKTGTPPRIKENSIDFSKTQYEPGTDEFICFSEETKTIRPFADQVPCHLIYTTPNTHKIINDNLQKSAMYSGLVKGVGPRYCPSIEDKLVRFSDKPRHQLFLEPESLELDTIYVQGFSTSMPHDIQDQMIHSLPGLEDCVVDKYAYAIEYDAINPLQAKLTLENKIIANLFTAGQINGTSGYEEAAGQGLIAGINAVNKLDNKEPLILKRDEAYIGVMIDDLCTKGTLEPYRLLTSRAEYRLLLRHDNADQRLTQYGYDIGLISKERYETYKNKLTEIAHYKEELEKVKISMNSDINDVLNKLGYEPLNESIDALKLITRPHITIELIKDYLPFSIDLKLAKQIEIEVKYAGYIEKAKREAKQMHKMDNMILQESINYEGIKNLSLEAKQKLMKYKPTTVGQASRISGINPSDIQVLAIYLQTNKE